MHIEEIGVLVKSINDLNVELSGFRSEMKENLLFSFSNVRTAFQYEHLRTGGT